ncbi:MAG: hypothetical protein WDZ59_05105 [Pirellulales bacterium]
MSNLGFHLPDAETSPAVGDYVGDYNDNGGRRRGSPGRTRRRFSRERLAIVAGLVLWGTGIAGGFVYAMLYEITPATSDVAGNHWPAATSCSLTRQHPTLVLFVHPHCPCSRATLNELSVLMTHCEGRLAAHVLFYKPGSATTQWTRTDLWHAADRIPGVQTRVDVDGAERRHFGARVSGEVFLYQASGELAFHGGITASRGHAGDNAGRSAIESLVLNHAATASTTPVFGCELQDSDAVPGSECCR